MRPFWSRYRYPDSELRDQVPVPGLMYTRDPCPVTHAPWVMIIKNKNMNTYIYNMNNNSKILKEKLRIQIIDYFDELNDDENFYLQNFTV